MVSQGAKRRFSPAEFARRARSLRIAVFDVDGVMTDGRIYLGASGEELKAFNVLDGHGLKQLQQDGVELAILSGRRAACVERRAAELGIVHVIQGAGNKLSAFDELLGKLDLTRSQAAFMGDDEPDLAVLSCCGLGFSVPDAPVSVRRAAALVSRRRGGEGAVREICELLVKLRHRRPPGSR